MPEKFEQSSSEKPIDEGTGRLLTEKEKELLEKAMEGEILEDKPQIMYLLGGYPTLYEIKTTKGLEDVKQMVEKDKAVIFVTESFEKGELPTLNEAIDLIIKQEGLIKKTLKEFGHFKTDRSIMDRNDIPREEREFCSILSHTNGYSYCDAYPPQGKKEWGYDHIETFAPPKLSEPFMMRRTLEYCSANWLEPHKRSRNPYDDAHLDKNNLLILEDPEVLKKVIETEANYPSPSNLLQKTIDQYFDGNPSAFQERWREYYQNWWPDEYRAMQDSVEETKKWLKTQKD